MRKKICIEILAGSPHWRICRAGKNGGKIFSVVNFPLSEQLIFWALSDFKFWANSLRVNEMPPVLMEVSD